MSLLQAALGQRDPVESFFRTYLGARRTFADEEDRKRQLAQQEMINAFRMKQEERASQKEDEGNFANAVNDFGKVVGAEIQAGEGKEPDPNWMAETWRGIAEKRGVPLAKYPDPGPYGKTAIQQGIKDFQDWKSKNEKAELEKLRKELIPAPQTRTILNERERINQEWDPAKGVWNEVGRGPIDKEGGGAAPSWQQMQFLGPNGGIMVFNPKTKALEEVLLPAGSTPKGSVGRIDPEEAQKMLNSERSRQQKLGLRADPDYIGADGQFSERFFQLRAPKKLGLPQKAAPSGEQKAAPATPEGKKLDRATAEAILAQAGGDRDRARALARAMGFVF